MKVKSDISILVVAHNHGDSLGKLIESLIKFEYEQVYFCDAASSDNTSEILENSPFKNNILVKKILESYSKNNNDLIRHFNLNTPYYLLLNPDTFFDMDFISSLYGLMEERLDLGITTPLTLYPDGRLQITWKRFPNFFQVIKKRLGILKAENEKQMEGPVIDWCLGACMLIREVFLKENRSLLDERYRLYCEDIDICFEASERGLRVYGLKEAFIYHSLQEKSAKSIFNKYNLWNVTSIVKFIVKWNLKYLARNKYE